MAECTAEEKLDKILTGLDSFHKRRTTRKSSGPPCRDLRGISHAKFRQLTPEQVARARAIAYVRISDGLVIWAEQGKILAHEFGVSPVTIHNVRYNLVYKDLPSGERVG